MLKNEILKKQTKPQNFDAQKLRIRKTTKFLKM